jgi:DNA-binding MarR family transcriptional regulator
MHALGYLARCNRYSDRPAAVGEYLGITKGTASQTLGALERKGLIEKNPDPDDGRVVHLKLTREGQVILESNPQRTFDQAISALSEERRHSIGPALESLLLSLQRVHGSRTFGLCRTCQHFRDLGTEGLRCGLTQEPLSIPESDLLCREHQEPPPSLEQGGEGP